MTRAWVKPHVIRWTRSALFDFNTTLDGLLPSSYALCLVSNKPQGVSSWSQGIKVKDGEVYQRSQEVEGQSMLGPDSRCCRRTAWTPIGLLAAATKPAKAALITRPVMFWSKRHWHQTILSTSNYGGRYQTELTWPLWSLIFARLDQLKTEWEALNHVILSLYLRLHP
jgi:hypothetical protein